MPFAGGNVVAGYLGFSAVKFAGYSLFCFGIQRAYGSESDAYCRTNANGQISNNWYCRRCRYNLRGYLAKGACPECGTPIDTNPLTVSPPPALDEAGFITKDYECGECGYNLRGLRPAGKCPECGRFIGPAIGVRYSSDMNPSRAVVAGLVRTLIGIAFGTAYWFLLGWYFKVAEGPIWLLGLLPIRVCEWWLLIWLFFDRQGKRSALGWRWVGYGVICSYLLDVPAMVGFCVTGGVSLC